MNPIKLKALSLCKSLPWSALLIFLLVACNNSTSSKKNSWSLPKKDSVEKKDDQFSDLVKHYEDPDRKEWQNPSLVLDKLGDLKGKTVADVGAGTGYFSFRLANRGAHVLAIDIDPRFLEYIKKRQQENLSTASKGNITTRLASADDPSLSDNEADLALLVNTYTFIDHRINYLKILRKGIRNKGKIVIVDYKSADNPTRTTSSMILPYEKVRDELEQAGFHSVDIDTGSLPYQYIITATK